MPNSADNSLDIDPASLREDSDVIELTEEVDEARKAQQASMQARAQEELPDLFGDDLSMPEFRVPADRTTDPKGVPQAAILGRKSRPRQHTPALETLKLNLDEIDAAIAHGSPPQPSPPRLGEQSHLDEDSLEEGVAPPALTSTASLLPPPSEPDTAELGALEESSIISLDAEAETNLEEHAPPARAAEVDTMQLPSLDRHTGDIASSAPEQITQADTPAPSDAHEEQGEEGAFDRQELVRTIQMEPVSRHDIELSIDLERLHHADALQDQRFAPDVVNRPPRILNRKWVEGIENVLPEHTPASSPEPSAQESISQAVDEEASLAAPAPQSHPSQPQHAPTPSAQPAGMPPQHRPSQVPPPQSAPPPQRAPQLTPRTQPAQQKPPVLSAEAPPSTKKDEELDGLVQELIDEASAPAAKKPAPQTKPKKQSKKQTKRDNWFKDVFTEEFLRTVPQEVDRFTEREALFIQDSLSLQHGSRILDLACGFGRHAIALTQRKMEIVGLDLSMALLQRALQDAQRRSLSIKFVHGDMRSMNFNEIFDGCYLWQNSFGYFDDVTNFKVLKDIARALKPGGRFLLDLLNRDYVVEEMPSRCWWEGRECIFLEEVDFDYSRSVLHTKRSFIYEDGSPPLEQNAYVRLYSMHEMMQLLKNAGFRLIEISGGLSMRGRFLGTNSDRMIFLLEKMPQKPRRAPKP